MEWLEPGTARTRSTPGAESRKALQKVGHVVGVRLWETFQQTGVLTPTEWTATKLIRWQVLHDVAGGAWKHGEMRCVILNRSVGEGYKGVGPTPFTRLYSYRRDSMGSRREARKAGQSPLMRPVSERTVVAMMRIGGERIR
jgi:hypothetical protein